MSQSSSSAKGKKKKAGKRKGRVKELNVWGLFGEVGHSIAFNVTWHESNASSMEIQAVPQCSKRHCVSDKGLGFIAPPCLHAWPALSNKAFRSKSQIPLCAAGSFVKRWEIAGDVQTKTRVFQSPGKCFDIEALLWRRCCGVEAFRLPKDTSLSGAVCNLEVKPKSMSTFGFS